MAGSSPAAAPMSRAAARPPAQASRGMTLRGDDDGPALGVGVDGGRDDAEDDPGGAACQREQDGLGQELGADLAAGGAQRSAQPDLLAALQDRDDHDVGHPGGPYQQRDRAQAEEQRVERADRVRLRGQRVRRLRDVDLTEVFRAGLRA
jgi:hypothetical protein